MACSSARPPSDARQGEVIAEILVSEGVTNIAVTYTNNDYGKGLAASFEGAFQALGGSVAANGFPMKTARGTIQRKSPIWPRPEQSISPFSAYADQGGKGKSFRPPSIPVPSRTSSSPTA